jgi:hypothetical protein
MASDDVLRPPGNLQAETEKLVLALFEQDSEERKRKRQSKVAEVRRAGLVGTDSAPAAIAQFMESHLMRMKRADQVVTDGVGE